MPRVRRCIRAFRREIIATAATPVAAIGQVAAAGEIEKGERGIMADKQSSAKAAAAEKQRKFTR
jgi:hypothetical protein